MFYFLNNGNLTNIFITTNQSKKIMNNKMKIIAYSQELMLSVL